MVGGDDVALLQCPGLGSNSVRGFYEVATLVGAGAQKGGATDQSAGAEGAERGERPTNKTTGVGRHQKTFASQREARFRVNNILQNIMALMLPLVGDVGAPLSTPLRRRATRWNMLSWGAHAMPPIPTAPSGKCWICTDRY